MVEAGRPARLYVGGRYSRSFQLDCPVRRTQAGNLLKNNNKMVVGQHPAPNDY
jgi:hypothetical protein